MKVFLFLIIFPILLVLIILFVFGLWILGKLTKYRNLQKRTGNASQSRSDSGAYAGTAHQQHDKIIPKDEGEYVEYEEVQ